ncbi:MAG: hypothetical protein WC459_03300 [Patescibacteria group bacterium]
MKKYLILAVILALAALSIGGFKYGQYIKEDRYLSSDPQTKEAYALIKQRQMDLKKDKNNYDAYMSLAFNWKGIGEVTESEKYLERSAEIYDKVIKKWGMKAYLPFVNQANVYIQLKEYKKAESDLKVANEIDPGEQSIYINLADLYYNYMKKSDKEVRAIYEMGIKNVVGGANLVLNYASYLNTVGDYPEALKYYKMLAQAFPASPGYAALVKELEGKINSK